MLAPADDDHSENGAASTPRRSPLRRLLWGGAAAALAWWLLPSVPQDQTVVLDLGPAAPSISRLEVHWQALEAEQGERAGRGSEAGDGTTHEGRVTLNFPAPTPERVVRQFRMTDGDYAFRITATHRDAGRQRTEVVRRVTLDGNTITLHLDELSP